MKEQKVEREPYSGEVIDLKKADNKGQSATNSSGEPTAASAAGGFHNRPATRAGSCEPTNRLGFFIFLHFQVDEIFWIQVSLLQVQRR